MSRARARRGSRRPYPPRPGIEPWPDEAGLGRLGPASANAGFPEAPIWDRGRAQARPVAGRPWPPSTQAERKVIPREPPAYFHTVAPAPAVLSRRRRGSPFPTVRDQRGPFRPLSPWTPTSFALVPVSAARHSYFTDVAYEYGRATAGVDLCLVDPSNPYATPRGRPRTEGSPALTLTELRPEHHGGCCSVPYDVQRPPLLAIDHPGRARRPARVPRPAGPHRQRRGDLLGSRPLSGWRLARAWASLPGRRPSICRGCPAAHAGSTRPENTENNTNLVSHRGPALGPPRLVAHDATPPAAPERCDPLPPNPEPPPLDQ